MNNKAKLVILILIIAALIGGSYLAYNSLSESMTAKKSDEAMESTVPQDDTNENNPGEAETPPVEEEEDLISAINFTVYDGDGNQVELFDYLGKPIVLNFWASWCPPCKGEFPEFEEVYLDEKDEITFIMLNMTDGQRETQSKAEKYIEDNGYTLPVLYDLDYDAAMNYGVSSLPTTLFIDSEGYVRDGYIGQINKDTLISGVDTIRD